jgi:uncharacterized protein involved in tellurium resistance
MKPQSVDLVLAVDSSKSMGPCFSRLKSAIHDLMQPLIQERFTVRFALIAYASAPGPDGPLYDHTFIGGSGPSPMRALYSADPDPAAFFTLDPEAVGRALSELKPQGNENTLLAIDIAADLPFGSVESTRRVIAVFTDEPLEQSVVGKEPLDKLPELIAKLQTRRIQLFVAAPPSPALDELGCLDGSQIEAVTGGDGLSSVDFSRLLAQMGKSISLTTLQQGGEPEYTRALYGQDCWHSDRVVSDQNRQRILAVGESVNFLSDSTFDNVTAKLKWTAPVDLDLHAIFRTRGGQESHVHYMNRREHGVKLNRDAGVGNKAGSNAEKISIESLENIDVILFATRIYSKGGCYADYDGVVLLQGEQGQEIVVPLTSTERADWCVIARVSVGPLGARVTNINRVENSVVPCVEDYVN